MSTTPMPSYPNRKSIEHMRSDYRLIHTPIIALIELAMQGDRDRCLNAGANDCVSKPIKLKELLHRIQACLT